MTALDRLQYELDGQIFGHGTDVLVSKVTGLGSAELIDREYDGAGSDGRVFGIEYRAGRDIGFDGQVVLAGNEVGTWGRSAEMAKAFDGAAVRKNARAVMPLRLRRPGADTVIAYGRPEAYDPDPTRAVIGLIDWSGTFRTVDPAFYSDVEESLVIGLGGGSTGYIVPEDDGTFAAPLRTVGPTRRARFLTNLGTRETWPVVYIKGPIYNPSVTLAPSDGGASWRLGIEGTLAYDQTAVIDTRPWRRSAALADGAGPLASRLTRDSTPSWSSIPPGESGVQVAGTDPTGTSTFTIRWRHAYGEI